MNIQNISVAGAVTYWKLGWANRRQLILESEDRGISGSWVPAARADIAVLKSILDLHFGQKEDLIRPLKGWGTRSCVRPEAMIATGTDMS